MSDNALRVYDPEMFPVEKTQKNKRATVAPVTRYPAPRPDRKISKRKTIIHQIFRKFKTVKLRRFVLLTLAALGVFHLFALALGVFEGSRESVIEDLPPVYMTEVQTNESPNIEKGWGTVASAQARYQLTDAERREVASVVTAEAAGEPYAGKLAVAQCILQACEDDGIRPAEALVKYGYAKGRPDPTNEALEAVQAVFDNGQVATAEPIKYFYAPALVWSEWHETQDYVMTINGHKFFKEAKQ